MNQPKNLLPLIELIRERNLKIGFAESCTGGLLSATFAAMPGVSDIFFGAVVSYSNQVKHNLLGVPLASLEKYGAVSEQVALEMATGACTVLGVDCAIAITGIAGPTGGSVEKPVGTVLFASIGPGFERVEKKNFTGSRSKIQQQSVEYAIDVMLNQLLAIIK